MSDPNPQYIAGTFTVRPPAKGISSGHVVALDTAGDNFSGTSAIGTTTGAVIGVALYAANPPGCLAVALPGSIVKVVADGEIDAGDIVTTSTVSGAVKALAGGAGVQVGVALEDIAPKSKGYILVNTLYTPKGVA